MKKLYVFLASISPGLFLIGYNIGTGSITTMASAGASYGLGLLLPVLLSCIFTYFLIVIFGRYTIITGDTVLQSYRKHFGILLASIVLGSLLISEWVSCMGVMGIVVQAVQEWSRPMTSSGNGFSPLLLALIFGFIIYGLFWQGTHRFFEKILTLFVGLMGICFILTTFIVVPSPADIIQGIKPYLPSDSEGLVLYAGMVGTTMGAILFVVRSILVQEKGWTLEDLAFEKRDAFISASMMFVLSLAVMVAAAGTMYKEGQQVDNAIDMVRLLEPLAGRLAVSVFVAGIVCAGLSSLFPIVLLAPWLIADFRSEPRNMKSSGSRLWVLWGVLLGLVIPVFGGRPVWIMIVSQAAISVTTPLVLVLMLILYNRKEILGNYSFSIKSNLLMGSIVLFTAFTAFIGIKGLVS